MARKQSSSSSSSQPLYNYSPTTFRILHKYKKSKCSSHAMLASKDDAGMKKAPVGQDAADGTSAAVSPATGTAATLSELVSRFDEDARKRLGRMDAKLKELETQMDALEAEMSRANDCSDRA